MVQITEISINLQLKPSLPITPPKDSQPAAVLTTESVHVTIDQRTTPTSPKPKSNTPTSQPAVINIPNNVVTETPLAASGLRTIELSTGNVREGFGI